MNAPPVQVAAAVIIRPDGDVLLAQRPRGKPYAGYWEFPGGKLEPGETPRTALDRELREELGIVVRRADPWLTRRHAYPHADVSLHFFRVLAFDGDPVGRDGQAFVWQRPSSIAVAPLLPANAAVMRALALPPLYGISTAADCGETLFVQRAQRAFAAGLSFMQVREKDWPLARQRALTEAVLEIAAPFGARVLLNGTSEHARDWGCAGVHWSANALARAAGRPHDLLCGASCHSADEVARAGALELDFAVLGAVLPTPSHEHQPPLGWSGFATALGANTLPVFALGGLSAEHLDQAIEHGAHGIALRSKAWGEN